MKVLELIKRKKERGEKMFAVLIDPVERDTNILNKIIETSNNANVDLFLIGGSTANNSAKELVKKIKELSHIPCVIFPSNALHIEPEADALLLLSLISGRNPDYLIGKHVESAILLKDSGLELMSTGYILVDSGNLTAVHYMSQSLPVPRGKPDIAIATALAGELLGLQLIYLEAGSGGKLTVPEEMISQVKSHIEIPLMVGGGIKTAKQAQSIAEAGADIIVVGNAIEDNCDLILDLSIAIHSTTKSSVK